MINLNILIKNGHLVFAQIKDNETLKQIPVVVMTACQAENVFKTYKCANSITKPVEFEQFVKIVQSIQNFWFTIVKLPPE